MVASGDLRPGPEREQQWSDKGGRLQSRHDPKDVPVRFRVCAAPVVICLQRKETNGPAVD